VRVAAIRALAALKDKHLAEIAHVAVKDKDPKVRSEGLQALASAEPAAAVKVIAGIVDTGTPIERQGAVLALSHLHDPEASRVIAGLVDKLIAGQLAPEIQVDVLEAAKSLNTPELTTKLAAYDSAMAKADEIAKYRVALIGGDIERGRKIFREKAETQCLRCHKNEIGDSVVGPELTHIGAKKDREYLLESIILPNKHIAEGFETVILTLKDGTIVAGRLAGQDANALKIETLDATGKPQTATVPLADVKQRDGAPSPMPPMGELMSRGELRDVVEYLATRR
jgi:quinoprotein glucose dehydrogenase